MKKVLRVFIHFTTATTVVGVILLLNDGDLDIYGIWNMFGFIAASYYIEQYGI